jgi:hypothetical protein
MSFIWICHALDGTDVNIAEARTEFPTQADAEAWMGESWSSLLASGADSVSLLEGDRLVYGPMGLSAG